MIVAGYMGISPALGRELVEKYQMKEGQAKVIGAIGAGVIAASVSHPFDTIKTCMQGDLEQNTYKGFASTAKCLWQQAGLSRFFNGWAWRTGRMICAVFIMDECKMRLSPLLFPKYFD